MRRDSISQRFSASVAFLMVVILISGCVGPRVKIYNGDNLPKSEVAVIRGGYYVTPFYYDSIILNKVDGTPLRSTRVEVLPGTHEFHISNYVFSFIAIAPMGSSPWVRVEFHCEAGHEYKIKGFFSGGITIIDTTTGAIMATLPWNGR